MNSSTRVAVVLGGAMVLVGLAGCADGDAARPAATPDAATSSAPASGTESSPSEPAAPVAAEHNEADVAFAQMMIVHHEGALEMAELATQEADSEEVGSLATEIEAAQLPEIELMESWLTRWNEPRDPAEHSSMDHGGMDMDGMSQEQVMDTLHQLSGPDFDERFLTAMIAHHEGAVTMSESELAQGENPEALELAQQIIEAQQSEIQQMQEYLQDL